MPQPAALNFLGSLVLLFYLVSVPASAPALTPIPHSTRSYAAPISAPECLRPQPSPSPNGSPRLCPTPGPRLCLASCGPSGPWAQNLRSTTMSSVPGRRPSAGDPDLQQPSSPGAPRPWVRPLAHCLLLSKLYYPGQGFPHASLPISFPTTSLPPPSPFSAQCPALELRPATEPHL